MEERKGTDRSLDGVRERNGHNTPAATPGVHCVFRHGVTRNPSNCTTNGIRCRTSRRQVASRRSGEIVLSCRCTHAGTLRQESRKAHGLPAGGGSERPCRFAISRDAHSFRPQGAQ